MLAAMRSDNKEKKQGLSPLRAGVLALALLFLLGCPPFRPSGAGAEGSRERGSNATATAAGANSAPETPEIILAEVSLPPVQIVQGPRFALDPQNARPGEPVTVAYSDVFAVRGAGTRGLQAVLLDSQGRRLARAAFFSVPPEDAVFGEQELRTAILAIPCTSPIGNAVIRIESADGIIRDLPFVIDRREFGSETIALNQQNTELRTVPDPQKTAESEQLWAILSRTGTEIYYGGSFLPPVTSTRRTSLFGYRRVYQYSNGTTDTAIHAGVDYGVPTGTEVTACAPGRVVLAKHRIVTGNTVILEHLPGLYSLYYHLDTIAVSEDSVVETGMLLGLSGATGLATGPHLHWEIRVSGVNADPDVFMSRSILDKKDILNRLISY
jgi:hypothetical protein